MGGLRQYRVYLSVFVEIDFDGDSPLSPEEVKTQVLKDMGFSGDAQGEHRVFENLEEGHPVKGWLHDAPVIEDCTFE